MNNKQKQDIADEQKQELLELWRKTPWLIGEALSLLTGRLPAGNYSAGHPDTLR